MTNFLTAATHLATGLWWLWLFGGSFTIAALFIIGLCRAASRPMPSQYGPRVMYGDLPVTADHWWPFESDTFIDPEHEAARLRSELNNPAAVAMWLGAS